ITDHGKKVTFPYCADAFAHQNDYPYYDTTITVPSVVMADATPGVLYNRDSHYTDDFSVLMQCLWVSFDYGQTWTFREKNPWPTYHYASNLEGLVYRAKNSGYNKGIFKSTNYGEVWEKIDDKGYMFRGECGFDPCDFFGIGGSYPTDPWSIYYTNDWFDTYTVIPIGEEYVFGNIAGIFPDIYRGALSGEVYVSSWFPDWTYKISFSADTGHTFQVVYHSDSIYFWGEDEKSIRFMSDRKAGVFYIVQREMVEMDDPWGYYAKVCISHYGDYGETLVGTYCHDLMMHYPGCCAGVLDMEAQVVDNNAVALQWSIPETESLPKSYRIYRNNILLQELPQTAYLDENLPNGSYIYAVRAVYADGCESLSYNTVKVAIDFTGIVEKVGNDGIVVYPNPTGGELTITIAGQARNELGITNVEVFDLMGRTVGTNLRVCPEIETKINIAHLPTGIYFMRITTETDVVTKKIVKQ
ncbi:MAG: T9SS type A sorting domain-containing protein, partial [Bacteroidales bacterium]|nr:T9SS type A sorting domain-containing protein [Bacteroidales bacterium]